MSYCKEFFRGVLDEIKEPFSYNAYLIENKAVYCDGFSKIIALKSMEIRLKIKKGQIVIEGENLQVAKLEENSIVVMGNIGGYRIEADESKVDKTEN